jgi:sulfane dehydrogenase subunit SoxC
MTDPIAGNGLLPRRAFLGALGAATAGGIVTPVFAAGGLPAPRLPGPPPSARGEPAPGARLERENPSGHPYGPGAGASSTPLQSLNGTLTPNALHFERHHSGIPDLDAASHRITLHGDVARALDFDLEDLLRYPMVTRTLFLECSGNSYRNTLPEALDLTAGALNGLVSTAEWTGVPLHVLLDEAGVDASLAETGWVIAEGADASANNRSLPMRAIRHACSSPAARAICPSSGCAVCGCRARRPGRGRKPASTRTCSRTAARTPSRCAWA